MRRGTKHGDAGSFRAIQGLGGGAIYALAFIVVGVLFPPEQRAKMQGIISSIWGISSILGPLAGGLIVEHTSWRWVFFVNLPITAIAIGLIAVGLKEEKAERHTPKLDLVGASTLLLGLLLMFYALSHSAHTRQPLNAELLSILALSMVILILFYFIERRAEEPILPLAPFSFESLPDFDSRRGTCGHGGLWRHQLFATLISKVCSA